MGTNVHGKVTGSWREANAVYGKVNGVWHEADEIYAKVNGVWQRVDEDDVTPPPASGYYVLTATSKYIPAEGQAWAEFDTSPYVGHNISEVDARISWQSFGSITNSIYGRPTGTFYRSLTADTGFGNRTIHHNIAGTAFNRPTQLAEFESGASIGYKFGGSNAIATFIKNLELRILMP